MKTLGFLAALTIAFTVLAQSTATEAAPVATPAMSTPLPGDAQTQAALLSAIIAFVVQQVKKYAGTLDPKLLALAAPVITTALAVAVNATETASINPATAFYIGLAATGLYEVAKHFVPNLNETAEQKMGRLKADIEKLKATPK